MTTWKMAARQALLCGVCAVALSGCGTALWPQLPSDIVKGEAAEPSVKIRMQGADAIANSDFDTAMMYAYLSLDEMTTLHQQAGDLSRGVGYLGTALGVGAGGAVLFNANTSVLKALALAGASLLGLSDTANAAGQRQVLTAGEDAMACIIATGHSYRSAVTNLSVAMAALDIPTGAPSATVTGFASAKSQAQEVVARANARAEGTAKAKEKLSELVKVPVKLAESLPPALPIPGKIDTAQSYINLKSVEAHNELREKTTSLLTALAAQTANLPHFLVHSTWSVRAAVRKQLADTAPDPSAVIGARRDAVISGSAELTAKAAAARAANKPGGGTAASPGAAATAGFARAAGQADLATAQKALNEARANRAQVDSETSEILNPASKATSEEKAAASQRIAEADKILEKAKKDFEAASQKKTETPEAPTDTRGIERLQLIAKLATDAAKPIDQVFQACIDRATVAAQKSAQEAADSKTGIK